MKTAEEYLESIGVDCDDVVCYYPGELREAVDIDLFKAMKEFAKQSYNQALDDAVGNVKTKYGSYWVHGEHHTSLEIDKQSILELKK